MRYAAKKTLFLGTIMVLAIARFASAQSFDDLTRMLEQGDRIRVGDSSGVTTSGRLTGLAHDSITLETAAGERRLTIDGVREIAVQRRSTLRGTIVGAAAFAVAGATTNNCTGNGKHDECGEAVVMYGLLGAGAGAIAGALIPRTAVVYRAPVKEAALTPVVTPHQIGFGVRIRW